MGMKRIQPSDDFDAQEKLYLEQEIRGDMDFEQIVGNCSNCRSNLLAHVLRSQRAED